MITLASHRSGLSGVVFHRLPSGRWPMPGGCLTIWILLLLLGGPLPAQQPPGAGDGWFAWRGPLGTGEAPRARPPVGWSENENVRWKTELPGEGHSTPLVVGDRVLVTAAEPVGLPGEPRYSGAPGAHDNRPITHRHRFLVLALDRYDGSILWERAVHEALPHEGAHFTGSLASGSPVTDGQRVYAVFGSYGVYCLDLDGNLLWKKTLGTMNTKHGHGEGSSPVLVDGKLIVNWDHEGDSFVVALDSASGEELWRSPRDEPTSWASPLVVEQAGRYQVVIAGTARIRSYDPENGDVIWECGGLSDNVVATPVAGDGMLFAGSSYETRKLLAIRLADARGDITDSDHVVWSTRDRTPYVPSPLLYRGALYYLRHYQGILSRREAATGEELAGPYRLEGLRDIYASPVAADGRIYVTDRAGVTVVMTHVDDPRNQPPRMLAANRIDDRVNASLALAGRQLFIRGEQALYCIEETGTEQGHSRD